MFFKSHSRLQEDRSESYVTLNLILSVGVILGLTSIYHITFQSRSHLICVKSCYIVKKNITLPNHSTPPLRQCNFDNVSNLGRQCRYKKYQYGLQCLHIIGSPPSTGQHSVFKICQVSLFFSNSAGTSLNTSKFT